MLAPYESQETRRKGQYEKAPAAAAKEAQGPEVGRLFVTCMECGAELRLNPKLAGTSVSCPQCGERVQVPKGDAAVHVKKKAKPILHIEETEPERPAPTPVRKKRSEQFTFFMMGAQAVLFLLALSCVWAAFNVGGWEPPVWSYFAEHDFALLGAAVVLVFLGFMTRYRPLAMTLAAVLAVCAAILLGQEYESHTLDASRTIALSMTLLAVWLAIEHRHATAPRKSASR